MKTKTILSVCMLTVLLYACTKSDRGPLDCMGVENGLAAPDDCGTCHESYSLHLSPDPNDIDSVEIEILVLAGTPEYIASNPTTWNASCTDCMGVENGLAVDDACGVCYESYVYDYMSHVPTYIKDINDTAGLALGTTEMLILAGSAIHIEYTNDWNNHELMAIDSCGDCHQSYIYNFQTHIPNYIDDTTGLVLDPSTEMLVLAGSADDIASNPNWNTGCTE